LGWEKKLQKNQNQHTKQVKINTKAKVIKIKGAKLKIE
jgi:hypothetical protein